MQVLFFILTFFFGSAIGSFLNVVILRLPRGQKLNGRSHCPSCGHMLGALDLVPLLSFILLSGKCRYCGHKISARYFIIELITGMLFGLAWLFLMPASLAGLLWLFKYWFVISVLVVVFVVDLEHYLILDNVVFPAAAVMLIFNIAACLTSGQSLLSLNGYFISGIIGAAALSLPFYLIWFFSKGAWMGFGDVKLAVFLGLALGWPVVLVGFMASVFLGGIVSVFLLAVSEKTLKSQIPFGTFLGLGTILALFYGERLLAWYLAFLGF